jgi:hypothetical protein
MAIWWRVLAFVGVYLVMFGMTMLILPNFTVRAFSLIIYADENRLFEHSSAAVAYIKLLHAVLGAVIVGWGAAVFLIVWKVAPTLPKIAWQLVLSSALAWFIPDTSYSLLSGFWQNAVLNLAFAMLFALPLWMIKKKYLEERID